MRSMPKRPPPKQNYMIQLGRWVAEQAAQGKMTFEQVADVYKKSGGDWPSSDQQISKLRTFWRLGDKERGLGVIWLAEWEPHRTHGMSTYDTLLHEIRQRL
jgi:hypothetical protein